MKKHSFLPLLLTATLFTGCNSQNQENSTALLSETVNNKPHVAILPLIDNSEQALGWNLSDEFTYTLCSKLSQKELFTIATPHQVALQAKKMKGTNNPFSTDISWMKTVFAEEDFVVFLELIEHKEEPNMPVSQQVSSAPETLSAQLNICLRLRVIDLRKETPLVTLQEIFQETHFVPRQFTQYNFHQASWNTEEFTLSPVGIAHAQLLKELKTRVEEYILIALRS